MVRFLVSFYYDKTFGTREQTDRFLCKIAYCELAFLYSQGI